MKNVILFGLLGLFSFATALDAEAGRRCGGRHHRRGCNTGCNVQQNAYAGGCQTYGYANGHANGYQNGGGYVEPVVDANYSQVPGEPQPVNP